MSIVTLDIVAELEERLSSIRVGNGYYSNAGLAIYRGRVQFDARIDPSTGKPRGVFPSISVRMLEGSPRDPDYSSRPRAETKRGYTSLIEIAVRDVTNIDNPQDRGHELLADVWRALNLERPVFGTRPIVPERFVIGDPEPETASITVTQALTVEFHLIFGEQ